MTDATNHGAGAQQGTTTSAVANGGTADVDFVALKPGQRIGRYEIVAVLGQGGFGITYRARDAQLGRDVAVKEYLPSALAVRQDGVTVLPRTTKMAEDFTWGRDRFVAEGRTLASLEHAPAIIQVFDFLEANGTAYIVMKLVPGDTLEHRIKRGTLSPAEIDRILWPLLDGLAKVHEAGFLHRDIKPANILLDADGNPTLIDFGASRAAMAGRTSVMTAIFTPGYAAAEQMTSAKQGPWTDIYGLSATLYHAITGQAPPSAFDRMLEDGCEPVSRLAPEGFSPGLLVGIDAGLAVKASDRPQSIAGWRSVLGQSTALEAQATVALVRSGTAAPTQTPRAPTVGAPPSGTVAATMDASSAAADASKSGKGLWLGIATVVLLALGGGGYYAATRPSGPDPAMEAAREQQAAADAEIARLRQEKAAREKADADAALRRQVEEETRKKIAAEEAERRKRTEAARQSQLKAQDEAQRTAEQAEIELRHTILNREHIQVSLTSLGFPVGAIDGVFTPRTREQIAAWQRARTFPATGFLDGPQYHALLREGSTAIAKYDESRKKLDDDRKAEEARLKAEEDARLRAAAAPPVAAPVTPPQQGAAVRPGGIDGIWQGIYECQNSRGGESLRVTFTINVRNGTGNWVPNMTRSTLSMTLTISGNKAQISRLVLQGVGPSTQPFPPAEAVGPTRVFTLDGTVNGDIITAQGTETPPGRACTATINRR
jgi:hypothetical protein